MRHLKKSTRLGRDREHREAMFSNLVVSLFQNERIKTTVVKAKELRRRSERLITRAKDPTLHNKRIVLRKIKNRDAVAKLFDDIAPRYKNIQGGYTRIIRLGRRLGDGAELSYVELVEPEAETKKKTKPAPAKVSKTVSKTTAKDTKAKASKTAAKDTKASKTAEEKKPSESSKPTQDKESSAAKASDKTSSKSSGKKTKRSKKGTETK